ncbi:hypothetical protein GW17_00054082, partial [Ensete ventricosum]
FLLLLVCSGGTGAKSQDSELLFSQNPKVRENDVQLTHSCIHDEILHQRHCWYNCTSEDISGEDKKRRLRKVTVQVMDENLGRMVTRVVLPRVVMHARHQYGVAVDGVWKVCPESGGPVQFSGFNGELICPAYHELCSGAPVPINGQCPGSCSFNGDCIDGECHCYLGFHGNDCSQTMCNEQCSLHGGVCDNGVCEFRCSDYAGYTCQNSSSLLPSLSICGDVLAQDAFGQHCAPSEPSILQQLEAAVVMPNYNRLMPGGRMLFGILNNGYCAAAAKRLACWVCYSHLLTLKILLNVLLIGSVSPVHRF